MQQRGISVIGIAIGVMAGIGLALLYAWQINPRVLTGVNPYQLSQKDQQNYLIVLSLAYARDRRVDIAAVRLTQLGQDWQAVANTACDLARTGFARDNTGLVAIRAMVDLAGSQGVTGCATALISFNTPIPASSPSVIPLTPTRVPPATKTPTPTLGATFTPFELPPPITPTPAGVFEIRPIEQICNPQNPGVIEIFVRDTNDVGLPGVAVEVSWSADKERFFTGLKPEQDNGYADFRMTSGESYTVSLPGTGERTRILHAGECTTTDASKTQTQQSFRVTFRRVRAR